MTLKSSVRGYRRSYIVIVIVHIGQTITVQHSIVQYSTVQYTIDLIERRMGWTPKRKMQIDLFRSDLILFFQHHHHHHPRRHIYCILHRTTNRCSLLLCTYSPFFRLSVSLNDIQIESLSLFLVSSRKYFFHFI